MFGVVGGHNDRVVGWCPEEAHPGTRNYEHLGTHSGNFDSEAPGRGTCHSLCSSSRMFLEVDPWGESFLLYIHSDFCFLVKGAGQSVFADL